MTEDQNPLIADPLTGSLKVAEQALKTANTGLELTREAGSGLFAILGDSLKDYFSEKIGLHTDRARRQRLLESAIDMGERISAARAERQLGPEDVRPVPERLSLPALKAGLVDEREAFRERWAEFLAAASDPKAKPVRAVFVDIIDQLEDVDGLLLDYFYRVWSCRQLYSAARKTEEGLTSGWLKRWDDLLNASRAAEQMMAVPTRQFNSHDLRAFGEIHGLDIRDVNVSIDILQRAGCLAPSWQLTSLCLEYFEVCYHPRTEEDHFSWMGTASEQASVVFE